MLWKMDDNPVHTTPDHHPPHGIIFQNQQRRPLPSLLSDFYSTELKNVITLGMALKIEDPGLEYNKGRFIVELFYG